MDNVYPQIKICGLTEVDAALKCAELGADAIGCNFYPKSPRYISDDIARDIATALPLSVSSVGVFVNFTFSDIMKKVEYCRLTAVQLHGQESPELVKLLKKEKLKVYKALFVEAEPTLANANAYDAIAFLIEQGKGNLPGGNARPWDWSKIRHFGERYPLILAGGLTPENVIHAISLSEPDAVDVSSGVESVPGLKDMEKVAAFITAVSQTPIKEKHLKTIF